MKVYKNYSQEELNAQYNTRQQVRDYAGYLNRWEKLSRQTSNDHIFLNNLSYGDHPEERLDIFPSKMPRSKTLVFIHGGYWHLLDKNIFHFLAEHFLTMDITTVFLNYPLAPNASIHDMVVSCRKALRWLFENIERFHGNPAELSLLGHSAGGHLAVMMMVEPGFKSLRSVISLSGLFCLEPVMLSYLNDSIGMDRENAIQNSPVLLNPQFDCPLLLVTGAEESDEFKIHTMDLFQSWKDKCDKIRVLEIPQKNHYSILDTTVERDSVLQTAILEMLNL